MHTLNELAKVAHENALRRRKITSTTDRVEMHEESCRTLYAELVELRHASEIRKSLHLPQYTEAQEELADLLIGCLTELHRRSVDVQKLIEDKISFNTTRV